MGGYNDAGLYPHMEEATCLEKDIEDLSFEAICWNSKSVGVSQSSQFSRSTGLGVNFNNFNRMRNYENAYSSIIIVNI